MRPNVMTLRELLRGLTPESLPPLPVAGIACHSKQLRPGDLFVAVRGPNTDGHQFLEEAVKRGAVACVVDHQPDKSLPCPVIVMTDTTAALAEIAARFYGRPVDRLRMIGITGTCGKTTTAYLTRAILTAAGQPAGLLGTVAYEIGARYVPSTNTTPGALSLQQLLAEMVEQGLQWCVMEVSSHALDQRRIDGLRFDAAIWTGLGSDHLDYHKTLEHYAASKRKIFSYLRPAGEMPPVPLGSTSLGRGGRAVINFDDPYAQTLPETLAGLPWVTFGIEHSSMVAARIIACTWQGLRLIIESPWGVFPISTRIVGRHNASNIAAACAATLSVGVLPEAIQRALADFPQVPGRLERVPNEAGIHAVVDFAHTADALHRVLLAMHELVRGRTILVFGCGGDRDQMKRPAMGQVASLLADHVILTSDNPRSEDPMDIIEQIKSGFVPGFGDYATIANREEAIRTALSMAHPEDAVLIAGKGHEAYQIIRQTHIPFSDREVVERFFRSGKTVSV